MTTTSPSPEKNILRSPIINGSSAQEKEEVILSEAGRHCLMHTEICPPVINEKRDGDKPMIKPKEEKPHNQRPPRKMSQGKRLPKTMHREEDKAGGNV